MNEQRLRKRYIWSGLLSIAAGAAWIAWMPELPRTSHPWMTDALGALFIFGGFAMVGIGAISNGEALNKYAANEERARRLKIDGRDPYTEISSSERVHTEEYRRDKRY